MLLLDSWEVEVQPPDSDLHDGREGSHFLRHVPSEPREERFPLNPKAEWVYGSEEVHARPVPTKEEDLDLAFSTLPEPRDELAADGGFPMREDAVHAGADSLDLLYEGDTLVELLGEA